MRERIKAVFFDIDGTLVSFTTHTVPESAREAIALLRDRGIKVFIATGRLLRHTSVVQDIEVDGYITVNGGCCITADGKTIFEKAHSRQTVERMLDLADEHGFSLALLAEKNMYVERLEGLAREMSQVVNIIPEEQSLRHIAATQRVWQMCPYIDSEMEGKILPLLPECSGSRWIDTFMDVNVKGVDKSMAVSKVMEYYGYTIHEAMAFGDGGNDAPMVRDAAVGIAMGNARDELKAVADYITDDVDNDGVYNALKHFGLI